MERRVNPHSFQTWFRPTRQQGTDNGKLLIKVPNRMFRKKLSETYGSLLEAVLTEVGMSETRVEFLCDEPEAPPPPSPLVRQSRLDFDAVDH
jgi:chromosomal replication initiator protein